jgi:outer membrane protein TolC
MKKRTGKFPGTALAVSFMLTFASWGMAQQENNATLILSLEQAKQHALDYNRTLQKAGLAIDEAQESLWQVIANGLPQVEAGVDYSNYLGFDMQFSGMSIPFSPTSNAKLTVSQLVFSGSYWVGVDIAKMAKKLAEKNVVKNELDVKENVTNAYFAILMAEHSKNILNQNLANMRDIYKRTSDLAKVEVIEQTDADQISIQVMNIEAGLRSVDRQIVLACNMLRLLLGAAPETEIRLTGNLDDNAGAATVQTLLANGFDIDSNIDFQMLKSQEEIQKKQITLDKMAYLPTVSGFYSYTYKLKKPAFDMSPPNVVGFQASIPIFSSFKRKAKVKQSKIQLQSLQKDIEQVEDQLAIQEKQLRFNLQTAFDQYLIQQKNVEVAKKVFESSARKHEHGTVSALDLTTSNTNYLQAENSLLSAKNDLLKAQTELKKLLGIL